MRVNFLPVEMEIELLAAAGFPAAARTVCRRWKHLVDRDGPLRFHMPTRRGWNTGGKEDLGAALALIAQRLKVGGRVPVSLTRKLTLHAVACVGRDQDLFQNDAFWKTIESVAMPPCRCPISKPNLKRVLSNNHPTTHPKHRRWCAWWFFAVAVRHGKYRVVTRFLQLHQTSHPPLDAALWGSLPPYDNIFTWNTRDSTRDHDFHTFLDALCTDGPPRVTKPLLHALDAAERWKRRQRERRDRFKPVVEFSKEVGACVSVRPSDGSLYFSSWPSLRFFYHLFRLLWA